MTKLLTAIETFKCGVVFLIGLLAGMTPIFLILNRLGDLK